MPLPSGTPIRKPLEKSPKIDHLEIIEPHDIQVGRLNNFLTLHPTIANSIIWHNAVGAAIPYTNWLPNQTYDLEEAFVKVQFETLSATPPLAYIPALGEPPGTPLSKDTAWEYFIAYVANSLRVEIYRHVPWSISSYTPRQLEILFDSKQFFTPGLSPPAYKIDLMQGVVTPGDPVRTRSFLKNYSMIKSDQRSTTVSLLSWCSENLWHFQDRIETSNFQIHWQYQGFPPVEKMISGTTRTFYPNNTIPHNWTAGCWGTTGFLKMVLRTVNIPVYLETRCGHAMPHFLLDNTYLSHGDDPYNWLVKTTHPKLPMDQLLIGKAAFDSWLPPNAVGTPCMNVARTPVDLAIIHLPNYLLYNYCVDNSLGHSHANGYVYSLFQPYGFTVSDLDALNLWSRMDAKILSLGGCPHIPEYS